MASTGREAVHPQAHERIWAFYLTLVIVIDLAFGVGRGHGEPALHAGLHLVLLAVACALPRQFRRPLPLAIARGCFTTVALVTVFSSLAWILPALHPEPFEWDWIAFDRSLFGVDPTVALQPLLVPVVVEVLQLCYAMFYFVPMVVVAAAARRGGLVAYDRCLALVAFGFLFSYLGYLLWPTLPPYRFLWHERAIEGVWLAADLHAGLESAELHRWNCFPSGHTMLSVLSLVLAWRHARSTFWWLLPGVVLLVFSTVALRYHYVVDVIAGLGLVPVALRLGRRAITP